jgi:hypothetical protein
MNSMTSEKIAVIGRIIALKNIVYALALCGLVSVIGVFSSDQGSNPYLIGFRIGAGIAFMIWIFFFLIKGGTIWVRVMLRSFGTTAWDCKEVATYLYGSSVLETVLGRLRSFRHGQ